MLVRAVRGGGQAKAAKGPSKEKEKGRNETGGA